jgi:phosphoribosylglycinamide formyltransferase-1
LISGAGRSLKILIVGRAAGRRDFDFRRVIASNSKAGGLEIARAAGIPTETIRSNQFASDEAFGDAMFATIRAAGARLVVLAGFMKFLPIPPGFENRVVNIHPGLIPAFCGRGLYGHFVHEAVLDYGAKVSGCTVHFVDNQYDHGPIILQRVVPVEQDDTPETLAARVFAAETEALPEALQLIAEGRVRVENRRVRVS